MLFFLHLPQRHAILGLKRLLGNHIHHSMASSPRVGESSVPRTTDAGVRRTTTNKGASAMFGYAPKNVSYAWELTSVYMCYSQGDGFNTSLSRLFYLIL